MAGTTDKGLANKAEDLVREEELAGKGFVKKGIGFKVEHLAPLYAPQ